MKKDNTPSGSLFSPELRETLKRLRDRPPELEAIVDRDTDDLKEAKEQSNGGERSDDSEQA